jgi:hypothetical protein
LHGRNGKSSGFPQNYMDTTENLLASREAQEHSGKYSGVPANLQEVGRKSFGFPQRKLM